MDTSPNSQQKRSSFFRNRSQRSNNNPPSEPIRARKSSVSKMLQTKADPNAAMTESQPVAAQLEASTLGSLKGITFYDRNGNKITDPDPSNPSRRRDERPLDTVRGFMLDIDRAWEGRRATSASGRSSQYAPRPGSSTAPAGNYTPAPGPRRSAGAYSPRAPPPMPEEPEQMHAPHGGDWNFNNKVGAMLAYADGDANENADARIGQAPHGGYPLRDRPGQQRVDPGYGAADYGGGYGPASGYGEGDYQTGGYRGPGYPPSPGYGGAGVAHDQGHPGRPPAAAAAGGPYGYGDGRS